MKISFFGLETVLECTRGHVTTFEIANRTLFGAICQSLISERRDQAVEPYMLWDVDDEPLKARDNPIIITNPLSLPWADKAFAGALNARFESLLLEDETARCEIEKLAELLSNQILGMSLQLEGNYAFGIEWGVARQLKAFGFSPERRDDDRLIDNLENFLSVAADVGLSQTLIFINLKKFLGDEDLERFSYSVKKSGCSVLLLESTAVDYRAEAEHIQGVDLQFLEY